MLKKCKKLQGTGVAISHDLTLLQRSEYRILKTFLNCVRQNPADRSYNKGNKLYVKDKIYTEEELEEINHSEHNIRSAPATPNIRGFEKEFEFQEESDTFIKEQERKKSPVNTDSPKTSGIIENNIKTAAEPLLKERT
ncbi:hypothetical protein JTB14_011637 [Gonioctena quinquepunctata]|nr:hypothetical protein JTB14_011637 [Gonioctena quinquepunctata]